MMKENKRTLIVTSIIILIPMIIGLTLWDMLPGTMATHFGFNNEANGFSSKTIAVIGIPMMLLALQWVGALVTSHDPKKQNITPKIYSLVLWIIPVISLVSAGFIYPYNLGYKMDAAFFSELLIGVMFIIIGNYMPKARPNYTIGIRVPWTLSDEGNWNRTHRFAGYLWVAGGIIITVTALTGIMSGKIILAICIAMALLPIVYSYWLHVRCGL